MKIPIVLLGVLALACSASAGVVGLFTSSKHDWAFVQKTGGMRIQAPVQRGSQWILPVEYDISGLTTITTTPTLMNSGMVVRKIDVQVIGSDVILKVVSQAPEKGKISGPLHLVPLPKVSSGIYHVYYESKGETAKHLGAIEIK